MTVVDAPEGPLVSVFLFSKDRIATIRRSVESVLAQTYRNIEYVIQDGASSDGTLEAIREFDDPRITLRSEPDSGPMDGYFRALRRCRGEYVCACLSDEELLPGAIEEAVAALEADEEAAALYRDVLTTDIHGTVIGETLGEPFDLIAYMAGRFCPQFPSAMFRRRFIEATGLHTRQWELECGEFEFWCRLSLTGPIRYLPGHAAKFACHDGQGGREPGTADVLARGRMRIVDVMAADTGMFDGRPALQAACRTGNGVLFAHHLLSLGADQRAIDLYADLAERSGQIQPPASPETASRAHISIARNARACDNDQLALQILEVAAYLRVDAAIPLEIARTYARTECTERALEMLDVAIGIDADCRDAHWERGLLLERRGEIDQAMEAWRKGDVFRDPERHAIYLIAALKSPQSTNRSLFEAHLDWARRHALSADACGPGQFAIRAPGERINIGYACAFWDADTITYQMLPVLTRHDRSRFTITAYVRGESGSGLAQAVDHVRSVRGITNRQFVRQVRADGIDILVELSGHVPGNWFAAMGARCAPIQVLYFNWTATSGVDQVDYVIGDHISVPVGTERFYTERVQRLPGAFFCSTYNPAELPPIVDPPSIRNGWVTFGSFGSGGKINGMLVAMWAEVLRAVPDARLSIRNAELTPADNRDALVRQFERHGIDRARLLILPGTTRQGILEAYADVDVSLDTFPYCGGNTIAEALWQGVPVVTLKGDRFSSAYGAAVLTASGLADLVADTPAEYVRIAAQLAGDRARLVSYRSNLRRMVMEYGFSDADRYTAGLETAYLSMLAEQRLAVAGSVGHEPSHEYTQE